MAGNVIANMSSQERIHTAKAPNGDLVIVNGVDRGRLYRGQSASSWVLGIDAPTVAPTITPDTGGAATAGDYNFYYRFLGQHGTASNLSPVATVTATLNQEFNWSVIAASSNARITQREIWRTIAGGSNVLYRVAVIADNTTTIYLDQLSDDTLIANAVADTNKVMVILTEENPPALVANRYVPPPDFKKAVAWFQDRCFYAGDVEYSKGTLTASTGSASITGSTTAWPVTFIGRWIYIQGEDKGYLISARSSVTALTISENLVGAGGAGLTYTIRPEPSERNLIYFSEPNEAESVPSTNTIRAQQFTLVDDEIEGLLPHGPFLYLLMSHHIYRMDYVRQPKVDATINPAAMRGVFNKYCADYIEDTAYLMDTDGPYAFSGEGVRNIGQNVQDYWRDGTIDFSLSDTFYVRTNPTEEVVRFFVCFVGDTRPKQSLCYHVRLGVWWLESYHVEIGAACIYPISGRRRLLLGGESDVMYLAGQGSADGINSLTETGTITGTVTGSTNNTIQDSTATFPTGVVDAPIAIIAGTGKDQNRVVSIRSSGTSLTISSNWTTNPDTTSVYLIGAIQYTMKTGTLRYQPPEPTSRGQFSDYRDSQRAVRLSWSPTTNSNKFDIRRYLNHNTSPVNNSVTKTYDDGLVVTDADPSAVDEMKLTKNSVDGSTVNSPGFTRFQFDGGGDDRSDVDRWLSVLVTGFQSRDQIKFYSMEIFGVEGG